MGKKNTWRDCARQMEKEAEKIKHMEMSYVQRLASSAALLENYRDILSEYSSTVHVSFENYKGLNKAERDRVEQEITDYDSYLKQFREELEIARYLIFCNAMHDCGWKWEKAVKSGSSYRWIKSN